MKPIPTEPPTERLVDDDRPLGTDELAARDLLRRLPSPAPLGLVSVAKIGDVFAGVAEQRRVVRRKAFVGGSIATAACLVALIAAHRSPRSSRAKLAKSAAIALDQNRSIEGSAERTTWVKTVGRARVALLGRGSMEASQSKERLLLRKGRLALSTDDGSLSVETPSARILIPPHATVEIEVIDLELRVAAYVGRAEVTWFEGGRTLEVSTGVMFASGHATPIDAGRKQEVSGLFGLATEAAGENPEEAFVLEPRSHRHAKEQESTEGAEAVPETASTRQLQTEAELLGRAVARLRRDHDPASALEVVGQYRSAFPNGTLRSDVDRIHVEILLGSDRQSDALALLDGAAGESLPRELRVIRGELRTSARRCLDALPDFDIVLESGKDALSERALYGRASCRTSLGDVQAGRQDLEEYLRSYPQGRFVDPVHKALAGAR